MAELNLIIFKVINNNIFKCIIYMWLSSLLMRPCFALFEDQVGKFDWQQQNIGAIISAHFDQNPGSRRIIVASKHNVIASINPKTSQINWRQVLEEDTTGNIHVISSADDIISVTGVNPVVRSWNPTNGRLNWETSMAVSNLEGSTARFHSINRIDQTLISIDFLENTFSQIRWHNYETGELIYSKRISNPWKGSTASCSFVSSSYFVCLDNDARIIYSLPLTNTGEFHSTPFQNLDVRNIDGDFKLVKLMEEGSNGQHLFALQSPKFSVLAKVKENGVEIIAQRKRFENVNALAAAHINDETFIFMLSKITDKDEYLLKVYNTMTDSYVDSLQESIPIQAHHGQPKELFVYMILKKEGGYGYRLLLTTEAHSLLLLQPGKIIWNREEALASILTAEMVDLPVSESEAQMEQQFGMANANVLMLSYKRLTTQLLHLQNYLTHFVLSLHDEAVGIVNSEDNSTLIRDDFNIHKILIAVTSVGKVFGIDNLSGKIIWQNFIPLMRPFDRYGKQQLLLFVQRTSTHYPHSPQCVILGKNKNSENGLLYIFNPINGEPLDGDQGIVQLTYPVIQASQLPIANSKFLRGILLLDSKYKVHVYPESTLDIVVQNAKSLYLFTAEVETGELLGLSLGSSTSKELIAEVVWSQSFSKKTQTITNVVLKRNIEHVHSQGRVMGDRSVLYKYLNPNLAVVTTEGFNPVQKSTLNVFLVDIVSGKIVFSSNHKRAKGPVHVVHSENWIIYSYFSEKNRRTEVTVLELYEGKTQSNTTAFSSLSPPPSPMIERQAYIFPYGIDAVTATITEKGITNKHLLFALPSGSILELPKAFLDPRRSLFPTAEHREEGVLPYNPELPFASENIINYYQSVYRIRGIYTTHTGLESTCLVLAYGLDLFFTRVTPSHTFDILKDDFDHWLIVTVLLGLMGASYLTKVFAAKKALKQAWK